MIIAKDPAGKYHLLLEDAGDTLGVSLCGNGHAGEWETPTWVTNAILLERICRVCCRQLGFVAENKYAVEW